MSNLVVLVLNDDNQATDAMATLRRLEKEGAISFKDTAIVSKDPNGKLRVKNEVSSATEIGAVAGGALGLVLTFAFPVVGLAVGALGGAAVGALMGDGIDRTFVKEVSESLEPGTSALFLLIDKAQPAVIDALKPYTGKVLQTTLPSDLEDRLNRALA